jgi:hypothetical protein
MTYYRFSTQHYVIYLAVLLMYINILWKYYLCILFWMLYRCTIMTYYYHFSTQYYVIYLAVPYVYYFGCIHVLSFSVQSTKHCDIFNNATNTYHADAYEIVVLQITVSVFTIPMFLFRARQGRIQGWGTILENSLF